MQRSMLALVGLLALVPQAAGAQTVGLPASATSGVTAVGHASVRRTADAVRVTANVNAPPGISSSDRADAVLRMFSAAGMSDAIVGFSGNNASGAVVTGTLRAPTIDKLRALAREVAGPSASVTLPPPMMPTPVPTNVPGGGPAVPSPIFRTSMVVPYSTTTVSFGLIADDCRAAIQAAQRAALTDAREQAQQMALAAGVRLGDVIGLNVVGITPGGCPSASGAPVVPFGYFPNDPSHPFDIVVPATVTVSYALGGVGRRAP